MALILKGDWCGTMRWDTDTSVRELRVRHGSQALSTERLWNTTDIRKKSKKWCRGIFCP